MTKLDNLDAPTLAVFQPDIAQNLGAMLRLTACLGVKLDVIEPCGFPISSKALRRSAMDYTKFAKIRHYSSYDDFKNKCTGRTILLTTRTEKSIWDYSFKKSDTLLVGRETSGVPRYVFQDCDDCLTVPIIEEARSLNVVAAAAIALGEVLRQISTRHNIH